MKMSIKSAVESDLVHVIAQRALRAANRLNVKGVDLLDFEMDVCATHLNGCPLRLDDLAGTSDEFSFVHDIFGIRRHLNRETGKLENHFLPRFSRK